MYFKFLIVLSFFLSLNSFSCEWKKGSHITEKVKTEVYKTGTHRFSLKIEKGERIGTQFYKDKKVASIKGKFNLDIKDNIQTMSYKKNFLSKKQEVHLGKLEMRKSILTFATIRNTKSSDLKASLPGDKFREFLRSILDTDVFNDVYESAAKLEKIELRSKYYSSVFSHDDERNQIITLTSTSEPEKVYLLKFNYKKFPKCK